MQLDQAKALFKNLSEAILDAEKTGNDQVDIDIIERRELIDDLASEDTEWAINYADK